MARITKNVKLALSKIDKDKKYSLSEAASLVKDISSSPEKKRKTLK